MKTNVADELMEAMAEMAAHVKGEGPALVTHTVMVPDVDVATIRKDFEARMKQGRPVSSVFGMLKQPGEQALTIEEIIESTEAGWAVDR